MPRFNASLTKSCTSRIYDRWWLQQLGPQSGTGTTTQSYDGVENAIYQRSQARELLSFGGPPPESTGLGKVGFQFTWQDVDGQQYNIAAKIELAWDSAGKNFAEVRVAPLGPIGAFTGHAHATADSRVSVGWFRNLLTVDSSRPVVWYGPGDVDHEVFGPYPFPIGGSFQGSSSGVYTWPSITTNQNIPYQFFAELRTHVWADANLSGDANAYSDFDDLNNNWWIRSPWMRVTILTPDAYFVACTE